MRSILLAFIALSLWMPRANAQAAVLIGLHVNDSDGEGEHPPSYRTLLITFRDGKAQLAADLPDLIIPRRDGFWRAGTLHIGPPGKHRIQEFVYAVPVRSVPHAIGEYHPKNPDWDCVETDQATIEFANPDLLSVSYFDEPACSLEVEFQHGTYKLDDLEHELEITAVLGATAWDAEKKADAFSKADQQISPDCIGVSKPDPWNWGIERSSRLGRSGAEPWILVSDFNTPHVCRDGQTYEFDFPIPESLTGPIYRADTLSSLLKSKVAKDNHILSGEALVTPAGDFLLAFGYGPPVKIFSVKPQGIQPEPALFAFTNMESNVVMVQWAKGKRVGEWETELQSLQKTHLPEPIVATGDPQH